MLTIPGLSRVGALLNPGNATYEANVQGLEAAAQKAKLKLHVFNAATLSEIERAFPAMRQRHVEALVVQTDSLFGSYFREVGELATRYRLPVIGHREVVKYGGLMSYEPNRAAHFTRAAAYVDRILKGAHPADLPVEQPTKFDLTINLQAAKTLGISVPREVLLLADEVIGM
jgi:putative ABC transport system substrate-binding protein